jgi:cytosine/adenosine deaminase-related metal-dependent hydrolase
MRRLWAHAISSTASVDSLQASKALDQFRSQLESHAKSRLFLHVGEGTDAESRNEFKAIETAKLLRPEMVLIHAIPFGSDELDKIKAAKASLVWSPRSNLKLYGATMDIAAVLAKDIPVALAPDWALTGSSNMLQELKCAYEYGQTNHIAALTPGRLYDMVTYDAARISGLNDSAGVPLVGRIRETGYADFLIVRPHVDDPFKNLLATNEEDIRAVIIGGEPVVAEESLVSFVSSTGTHEPISIGRGSRQLLEDPNSTPWGNADLPFAAAIHRLHTVVPELAAIVEPSDGGSACRVVRQAPVLIN